MPPAFYCLSGEAFHLRPTRPNRDTSLTLTSQDGSQKITLVLTFGGLPRQDKL